MRKAQALAERACLLERRHDLSKPLAGRRHEDDLGASRSDALGDRLGSRPRLREDCRLAPRVRCGPYPRFRAMP